MVYTFPCWNFNFFIWRETETWTRDSSWKKEMIDDIVTLVMYLRCDLRTRHGFEKKSHYQVDDFTNQRYQYKFQLHAQSRSWKMERSDFFAFETWSVNYDWYWEYVVCLLNVSTARSFKLGLPYDEWFGIRR